MRKLEVHASCHCTTRGDDIAMYRITLLRSEIYICGHGSEDDPCDGHNPIWLKRDGGCELSSTRCPHSQRETDTNTHTHTHRMHKVSVI